MRRFELVEGSSAKFWEIQVEGSDVTVRFGRIGTAGQTKTKANADAAAARKEHDKLVKEKTGKGYAEVTVAAGAKLATAPAAELAAPAAAVRPAPAAPLPEPVAPPAPVPPVPPRSGAIEWPQGGFEWDDALLGALPVVRGIHVPALEPVAPWNGEPLVLTSDQHGFVARQVAELATAAGRPWTAWGPARSAELTSREQLARADHGFWLELCAQALAAPLKERSDASATSPVQAYFMRRGIFLATRIGIELHGLPFMVGLALELAEITHASGLHTQLQTSMLAPLRLAIAAADDAAHAAALAAAEALRGRTEAMRLASCCLFPHREDWAVACLDDRLEDKHQLLKECVLPAAAGLRLLKDLPPHFYYLKGAVLLQLRLHGEGVFDVLVHLLAKASDRDGNDKALALITRMKVPRMIGAVAEWSERKEVRQALDKLAERFPAAVLVTVIERALAARSRLLEGWAVRMALRDPAALALALPALGEGERSRFEALLASLNRSEVALADLPPLLREPPWLRKARATELPTLAINAPALADRIDTPAETKAREAAFESKSWRRHRAPATNPEKYHLDEMQITPDGQARVLAGEWLRPQDVVVHKQRFHGESPEVLVLLPDVAALAVWNSYPAQYWYAWEGVAGPVRAMLARHGTRAIEGLVRYTQSNAEEGLAMAMDVDSARLVPTALHALRNLKKAKAQAVDWLRAHAATALAVALPVAFGADKAARDDAQFGLRWFVANGFEAQAREIAARLSSELPAALQALLDADPLLVLPARMPKLPAFFVPASFRRPELREGGGVLPAAAAEHIGSMLAISKIDAPYAGLALVRAACSPDSLAEFAWDMFEAWLAAGAPSKEGWAFTALGLLGNDETARRLAPRIREWPGESAHLRAVAGLDLLAAIGSDVALMHLNGIASKVKFKALQDRAREKIAVVAEARGLSAAELADRLVPDLGLDDAGSLRLDFGPRAFFVGFDESLKPFVKDAQGVRLKDLPKPIRSDDAALAEAATERYKQMKKDAKAVASLQVVRLELGMVDRRRWSAANFRLFFLEHPLMRHLAARLVWGVYGGEALLRGVRVAEDWTLADAQDTLTTLPDDAIVGIAHVLEMPAEMQAAFGQVFADYEILQPFRQLGRETYALSADEAGGSRIERFAKKVVATGSVLGLVNRGWERGQTQDGGFVGWFSKRLGDDIEVHLEIEPGTVVGDPSYEPKQSLPALELRRSGTWDANGLRAFGQIHPILASEVLRDVDLLAAFKE